MPTLRTLLSSADGRYAFTELPAVSPAPASAADDRTVVLDPSRTFQPLLGFGSVWTDTDVYNLLRMPPEVQHDVLVALFDPVKGAGWNFMRLPFGSTDWESTCDYYTYDDMPYGEKDWALERFSVERDIRRGLFDLARRCLDINPDLVFLGSVWGVPAWMKENDSILYGRFNPACTEVYARYLRMAVEAYEREGIHLYAVTPQNESLTGDDRATPACRFTWRMQKDVVIALRREFESHGITTQIWVYDHNFDMARAFVEPMLADPEARAALDAVAFHDYGGSPAEMGRLAAMHPDVPFYMTERLVASPGEIATVALEFRNGARSYLQWTTIANEFGGPHQYMGRCHNVPAVRTTTEPPPERRNPICCLMDHPERWTRTRGYYLYGQITKYLRRGMVRIDSTEGDRRWVTSAAFRDPATGFLACLLVNQTDEPQRLRLRCAGFEAPVELPAQSVATCLWDGVEGAPFAVADAPAPAFPHEPAYDLEPQEILFGGELRAGEEILLSCRVKNVGDAPTADRASLSVRFSLDGDCHIARAIACIPSLAPGEEITVSANVPFQNKRTWTAEAGWHTFFAFAELGNCPAERNMDNNRMGTERFFA